MPDLLDIRLLSANKLNLNIVPINGVRGCDGVITTQA